jgi:tight adherence protein C
MTAAMPIIFVLITLGSVILFALLWQSGRSTRLDARVASLCGKPAASMEKESVAQIARATLPKLGSSIAPTNEAERTLLQLRLVQAGLYQKQAMPLFLGVKLLLIVIPFLAGNVAWLLHLVSLQKGMIWGCAFGLIGMIVPSFWLDKKRTKRQSAIRRGLPDALDLMVICLEGGLSLSGTLARIVGELQGAHSLLASELNICQREIQLGQSPGDSLVRLGERSGMDELKNLATVIVQAERFGASLVKSLRTHSDSMRLKYRQHAEEMAQKAGVKILLPTLLFIFPSIFVVILGPGTVRIMTMLDNM